MGIIVLTIAILPLLGIGGTELFGAESSGPTVQKLHPRIRETARRLWFTYLLITAVETSLLMFAGLNWFDAINHAMSTVATGGFSTKNASVGAFNSQAVEYIIIIFMFISGINFSLIFIGFKGKLQALKKNEEFIAYCIAVLFFSLAIWVSLVIILPQSIEQSFRDATFQVISVMTGTGFITADFTTWAPALVVVFLIIMFLGGSSGSTAGGIKFIRHVVLFKDTMVEFKRLVHPSAIMPVKVGGKAISLEITQKITGFLKVYILLFALGTVLMSISGTDIITSAGAIAASIGNVGPGIGEVGPVSTYEHINVFGKWVCSIYMILGRLEIFTVLVLFTPYFWRNI